MEAILLQDVYSAFRKGKELIQYGRKGEKVKLIATHNQILIVEKTNGIRFPIEGKFLNIKS